MGIFNYVFDVGDPQGQRFESVEAMVDTGSTFTVLPATQLERLGVPIQRRLSFEIADGSELELDVGETLVRLAGQTITTTVVFGEEGTPSLLGAVALETAFIGGGPSASNVGPGQASFDGCPLLSQSHLVRSRSDRSLIAPPQDHTYPLRCLMSSESCDRFAYTALFSPAIISFRYLDGPYTATSLRRRRCRYDSKRIAHGNAGCDQRRPGGLRLLGSRQAGRRRRDLMPTENTTP